jgi:hypothetical protein
MISCHCTGCIAEARSERDAMRRGWQRSPENNYWYCRRCIEYSVDPDTGDVLCPRHDIPRIRWGHIRTGPPGAPNRRYGTGGGRRWITEDRGGWTVPRPLARDEEEY